ncbi:hypothetical protein DL766_005399 [Monosporascus sp. MC13-8B]|uniref:Uncharacterized protein n=1 Tax=Monosporascus cannonballus TaxID=155416 RepID=A0ABY0HEA3_9PEZI|nr:hypothetical protein DL762_002212 [Monosporascus cannonballus]RYP01329.1 hypothetical protein DL763_000301 [Monosporascus cannonballus]RYP29381.1 hypothetical protein DL766_005399 [Monosporascus sp. MC13-8B]
MACGGSSHSTLVDRNNGPGSAASSTIESIVKPAEATGGKTRRTCVVARPDAKKQQQENRTGDACDDGRDG